MSLLDTCGDEAALRVLDRKCAKPDSVISKRIVAQLAGQSPAYQVAFLDNITMWALGNLFRCVLEAGVSPDSTNDEARGSAPMLLVAARHDASRALKALLAGGASVDLADKYGFTALAMAAQAGSVSCLQLLFDAGANANTQDCFGNTPLM